MSGVGLEHRLKYGESPNPQGPLRNLVPQSLPLHMRSQSSLIWFRGNAMQPMFWTVLRTDLYDLEQPFGSPNPLFPNTYSGGIH